MTWYTVTMPACHRAGIRPWADHHFGYAVAAIALASPTPATRADSAAGGPSCRSSGVIGG
jgi:hypothetical protein